MEKRNKILKHFRELDVYQKAFISAMKIFELTKTFPKEETYSLVDQIRRSSRGVCSNLAEAWRKRKYIAVFKNKLTDLMQEASETQSWLEFGFACKYIEKNVYDVLDGDYKEILLMLNSMEKNAEKFCF